MILKVGVLMSSKGLVALINEIKEDVKTMSTRVPRYVAEAAFEDLKEAHESIVNSYYGGYTPVKTYKFLYTYKDGHKYWGVANGYRRKNNFKNNSIVPIGVTGEGTSYSATIEIGSSGMSDYTNSSGRTFPGSAVFDMIWNQGIRGLPAGYLGHVGDVEIDASAAGIGMSGIPATAMNSFMDQWGAVRFGQLVDKYMASV